MEQPEKPVDSMDGYPCGTNESLWAIHVHVLKIKKAVEIHLEHQRHIKESVHLSTWTNSILLLLVMMEGAIVAARDNEQQQNHA